MLLAWTYFNSPLIFMEEFVLFSCVISVTRILELKKIIEQLTII